MVTEIIVLSILAVMIVAAIVLSKKTKETEETEVELVPEVSETENNDEELIAVLTAAVMAYSGSNSGLVVRSFRKVGDNSPRWNKVSRIRASH